MVYLRRRRRLNKELWNDVVGTVVRGCRAEVGKKQPFSVKGQIVNILGSWDHIVFVEAV